jgi:hypothetical protein
MLQEALAQDDLALEAYMKGRLQAAPELSGEVEQALRDEMEALQPKLTHGLQQDLPIVLRQRERLGVSLNPRDEAIRSALRLREERIERERIELQFVFDDLAVPDQEEWILRAALTIQAKRLIDSQFARTDGAFGARAPGR